tara:strand:- start:864 stop:1160 length:297 start_codon:yes stop_codon:yes gene_type:complete
MSNNENQGPSLFKMIRQFGSELTKYIKEGAPNVTPTDYARRLDICMSCEYLKKSAMRCGKCGCLLEHKAKWKTSDCPEEKWPKQDPPKKEEKPDLLNG